MSAPFCSERETGCGSANHECPMISRMLSTLGWPAKTGAGAKRYENQRLFPLSVVATLSTVIFALNFCLEIFALFALNTRLQALILSLQICLAAWAFAEAAWLRKREPSLALGRLLAILGIQCLLEGFRLALVSYRATYRPPADCRELGNRVGRFASVAATHRTSSAAHHPGVSK